jgi:hypothetical protein
MVKYFCDECKKELTTKEVEFSLTVTRKELCSEHVEKYVNDRRVYTCQRDYKTSE